MNGIHAIGQKFPRYRIQWEDGQWQIRTWAFHGQCVCWSLGLLTLSLLEMWEMFVKPPYLWCICYNSQGCHWLWVMILLGEWGQWDSSRLFPDDLPYRMLRSKNAILNNLNLFTAPELTIGGMERLLDLHVSVCVLEKATSLM